ncbi:MAG: hypothetical protein AAGG53_00620 [Cyanobacteria bacterium P01_H01_bin.152]
MASLEPVTGVREHDAENANHTIRDVIYGIVTALHVGDLVSATQQAEAESSPNADPVEAEPVEVAPVETPEPELSPQSDAGQFTGSPDPEALGGQGDAPQLPGAGEADALELTPEDAPDPSISVRVGEVTIESPLSQLTETLHQQSPETLEELRSAIQDEQRSPDAPAVEIRADDQLKFYRDADNLFVASDFEIPQSSVADETIAAQSALEGEVQPEATLPESEAVEVQVEPMPVPVAESIPVAATEEVWVDDALEAVPQQPVDTVATETQELEAIPVATEAEPALDLEETTPTQVVQIPVSEAEALGGQTLAESSTVNPDVWASQTQVFTAEVDSQGNVQPMPTAAIGQSVDAVADQVEITEESQETAVEYTQQLETGREQTADTAETHDQFFDDRRETSDELADTHDQFFDERRATADAEAIADVDAPASHQSIANMLDQACDMCYGENAGTQTIQGNHYVISREGDSLSVTAKDGRGTLLEKNGDQVTSFLTPQDEQALSAGFGILQQQQERQGGQPVSNTSAPMVAPPAAVAGKSQMEIG